ncbi:regulator of ribonuclease activity A [Pseudobacteriovorax antillogorgiicola]|uniref:4-hydroxy-4-methyl-2-oxoglutarate aldolase n=2 Tax=Pseudobacteriovorax antillogorgiicola TaxID=1513793 RepID=A0A1Y6BEB6_9BACT|nr:ribonuclease E activity regulator RraA [Pseudobacteriovorax antillogorgiicola]TCS56328.1 regulator of ribonuclease activity A [Pseudobacteriovorax antillogorgiicola]SMF07009.1 regulator of ribonuclease activity A [Pseudobacteriovorax antillogorgiicola]
MKASADVCDALGEKAHVLPLSWQSFGKLKGAVGPVATVKAPEDNTLVREALEKPGFGRVLVVDGDESLRCALLGGNLAELAATNSWAGVVVAGAVRDHDELIRTPIGIFALGTCPRKSLKRGLGEHDAAIRIGGVAIAPGDHIVADADGVVVVAKSHWESLP